jgi:surface protein
MISYCYNLRDLDISSFNTQSITDMRYMFHPDTKLKSLSLGPNFEFQTDASLPTYSTPWVKQGTTSPMYSSAELMSTYDGSTMAGTYVRICNITISIKRNDLAWTNNGMKVALYQNGEEIYAYNQATISETEGTITWYDVEPGTYDIYSTKDSNNISILVDTGKDIVVQD